MTIHAQIGDLFPPLELVRHMRDGPQPDFQVLAAESNRWAPQNDRNAKIIYVGIRMPEFHIPRGNLPPRVQRMLLQRIQAKLKSQLVLNIVQTTLAGDFAFCYPYLRNTAGDLVFCRLEIRDHIRSSQKPPSDHLSSTKPELPQTGTCAL